MAAKGSRRILYAASADMAIRITRYITPTRECKLMGTLTLLSV